MQLMAKRKRPHQDAPAPSGDKPRTQRSGAPLHAWIDEDLMEAFNAFIDSRDPRVSKTASIESALREYLRSQGFWPYKK